MSVDREVTRRSFMRRALGAGVGLLSLEFVGASLAFAWPNITEGLGARIRIGTMSDILTAEPRFAQGHPYHASRAQSFLVNIPAARALASGEEVSIPEPSAGQMVALWRRCPHLGCMVPAMCDERSRFECLCHGSTYNALGEKLERGPASRGMDRFAVELDDDGSIVIDTREIIRGAPEGVVTFRDPHPQNEGCAG